MLTYLCLTGGMLLRFYHYLDDRGLWFEEALLVINFLERGFAGLTRPLDYEQQAPMGFVLTEKILVLAFGEREQVLRLFPFLCGLGALAGFYRLASAYLNPLGTLVAVAGLAFAYPVVYHSVEAKQYSTELLVTVLLYLAYRRYGNRRDLRSRLRWGLAGAAAVWFSFPSVFVLGGIGAALLLPAVFRKDWRRAGDLCLPFALWGISFLVNYFLFIRQGTGIGWLVGFWENQGAFMPLRPFSPLGIGKWLVRITSKALDYPLGLNWMYTGLTGLPRYSLAGLVLLPLGIYAFFRRERKLFLVLAFPLVLAVLASGLKLYPVMARLLLFAVPIFFLWIGYGAQAAAGWVKKPVWSGAVMLACLLAPMLYNNFRQLADPAFFHNRQDAREAFLYVKAHSRPGEKVYVHNRNYHSLFRYYRRVYRLPYEAFVLPPVEQASGAVVAGLVSSPGAGPQPAWFLFNPGIRYRGARPAGFPAREEVLAADVWLYYLNGIYRVEEKFSGGAAALYRSSP